MKKTSCYAIPAVLFLVCNRSCKLICQNNLLKEIKFVVYGNFHLSIFYTLFVLSSGSQAKIARKVSPNFLNSYNGPLPFMFFVFCKLGQYTNTVEWKLVCKKNSWQQTLAMVPLALEL